SKPVSRGSPTVGRFDSCAAPLRRRPIETSHDPLHPGSPRGTNWPGGALQAVVIGRHTENLLHQQLARTPLLSSVGLRDLRRLGAEGRERHYAEGDVVVREGDEGGAFFI